MEKEINFGIGFVTGRSNVCNIINSYYEFSNQLFQNKLNYNKINPSNSLFIATIVEYLKRNYM